MILRRRLGRRSGSRFRARTTVTLLAATALTAGCTSAPVGLIDPANRAAGSATIVWTSSPTLRNASDDVRQVLVDAFEQAYPALKVRLEPGSDRTDRLNKKLFDELSAGSVTPDVYSGDVIWPAQFGQAGLALPLNRYLPGSFWQRYDRALVQAMTYQGNVYAAPYFVDKGFLFYRKDVLKRAGLNPPSTWEELESDALTLRRRGLPYQFAWQGNDYEGLTCDWMEFMTDAFGAPPDEGIAQELASPQALHALDFMQSLLSFGISAPNTGTNSEQETDKLFDAADSSVAFLRSWDSSYASAMGAGSGIADPQKVGVETPPAFAGHGGRGYSAFGGWSLFVNPHTRNLDAALTFVRWMTGEQAQRILATQFSEIPANNEVLRQSTARQNSPVLVAAAQAQLVSRPSQTPDYSDVVSKAIFSNIHEALFGTSGVTPCEALINAAQAIGPAAPVTLRCPR